MGRVAGAWLVAAAVLVLPIAARAAPRRGTAPSRGFRHTLTLVRAADAKDAQEHLERAMARLHACLRQRAEHNPKLRVHAKLRFGVSRARVGVDGQGDSLLAVKVLDQHGLVPEVRGCIEALGLTVLPRQTDFEAVAEVVYAPGGGR